MLVQRPPRARGAGHPRYLVSLHTPEQLSPRRERNPPADVTSGAPLCDPPGGVPLPSRSRRSGSEPTTSAAVLRSTRLIASSRHSRTKHLRRRAVVRIVRSADRRAAGRTTSSGASSLQLSRPALPLAGGPARSPPPVEGTPYPHTGPLKQCAKSPPSRFCRRLARVVVSPASASGTAAPGTTRGRQRDIARRASCAARPRCDTRSRRLRTATASSSWAASSNACSLELVRSST